jgi:hypothetical protein
MAHLANRISGDNTTFTTGVGDWAVVNGTARRELNLSVYSNFGLAGDDSVTGVKENAAKVTASGAGVVTFELGDINLSPDVSPPLEQPPLVMLTGRVAGSAATNSFARPDITYYNTLGVEIGQTNGVVVDTSTFSNSEFAWALIMPNGLAPSGAVKAKVTLTFAADVGMTAVPTAGDYWLVASPALVVFSRFDWFTYRAYQQLPGFVKESDDPQRLLYRFMQGLFSEASEIREIAKSLRYDRAVDGVEHKPALVDPDNMPVTYFKWLASILGVRLGASDEADGSTWDLLYTLADTSAGRPHNSADGTSNDGDITWAEWNREFGSVLSSGSAAFTTANETWTTSTAHGLSVSDGVRFTNKNGSANPTEYSLSTEYYVVEVPTSTTFKLSATVSGSVISTSSGDSTADWDYDAESNSFIWSNIANAGAGSYDGEKVARAMLKSAASGVNAGKLAAMDSFYREFVVPSYQFLLRPREYSSPKYTRLIGDSRDITDGGLAISSFFDLISPAGSATTLSISVTPVKNAAAFAFLSDYGLQGVGVFGPQGFFNEGMGRVIVSSLMNDQSGSPVPVYGGIIGPAPFGSGNALLSGYRVSMAPPTSADFDLGSTSHLDFDIIVGISAVRLPTAGSRTVASGDQWAVRLTSDSRVAFVWDGSTYTTAADSFSGNASYDGTDTWTSASHGLSLGDVVTFTSRDAAPAVFTTLTPYYVIAADTNTFQLSATPGGEAVPGTGASGSDWAYTASSPDATYSFEAASDDQVQYVRISKVGTSVTVYAQDSLYGDWDNFRLGAPLTLASSTGTPVSGAASVTLLSDADPTALSSNASYVSSTQTWTTGAAHSLSVGDILVFYNDNSSTGPTEYSINTTYYVIATPTTTTFQLSETAGGSAVTTTADSSANWDYDVSSSASLSCALHRFLLFTTASGNAWTPEASNYYDYEGSSNLRLDTSLEQLTDDDYYSTSFTLDPVTNPVSYTVTDLGGANLNDAGGANDLTVANDGSYDYVTISTQELSIYDYEPIFPYDEFSYTVVVADPAGGATSTGLVNQSSPDISTVFNLQVDSGDDIEATFSDGTTTLAPTVIDTSGWGAGEWHTITVTYSPNSGLKVYEDGVEASSASGDLVLANSPGLNRLANIQVGDAASTGSAKCRFVGFHRLELSSEQALALAGELGTVV